MKQCGGGRILKGRESFGHLEISFYTPTVPQGFRYPKYYTLLSQISVVKELELKHHNSHSQMEA